MITLPLKIRYGQQPRRETAAWLIPGHGARAWLAELVRWEAPLGELQLYIVPQSRGELAPRGILVPVPGGRQPRVSGRCQPYGRIGQCEPAAAAGATPSLYLPVEAWFDPDVTAAEVEALLTWSSGAGVHLLHPAAGLILFERGEVLRVADLLEAPPRIESAWDCAQAGIALSPRLTAILPESPPSVEEVFTEGRDDIASRPPTLDELPPSPEEPPGDALSRFRRAAGRQFAKLVKWFADQGAKAGGKAQSPGRLAAWAQRQLARLDQTMLRSRHSEILRLMHLLATDPDEGLRYAVPFSADHLGRAHRGIAPPSGQLGRHDTDFNLNRLGGGAPADPWNLPHDFYAQLRTRYIELASRELRLGRHRRAAYVYGELLGDLESAASALVAGRHWREAAVLYRERLNRPEQAARCLEQGGLWTEAVALYEELGEFEKAGDLYARLDQAENAAAAYRRAVETHLARGDLLAAASLLEEKLRAPDEALDRLAAGWPDSPQAGKCLGGFFSLLARLGRHDAAVDRIQSLRRAALRPDATRLLAETLASVATSYPGDSVRALAADAVRTVAARRLRAAQPEEKLKLVDAVRRLAPEDRLLGRDCVRYVSPEPRRVLVPRVAPSKRHSDAARPVRPSLVSQIALRPNVDWQCAVAARNVYYAAGYQSNKLVVFQGLWSGSWQAAVDGTPMNVAAQAILLVPGGSSRQPVLIRVLQQAQTVEGLLFSATDEHPEPVRAHTPSYMPQQSAGAARNSSGQTWIALLQDIGLELRTFGPNDEPLGSRVIPYSAIFPAGMAKKPTAPIPLCARDETLYVALNDRLVVVKPEGQLKILAMPDEIRSLCTSPLYSRVRVVATLDRGAVIYWDDYEGYIKPWAAELNEPCAGFTRGGRIVLASARECHVYRTEAYEIHLEACMPMPGGLPLAVLAPPEASQFALFSSDGIVRIYRVPTRDRVRN
jgi:tetratricopeptide (TPR) repeat protein